MVAMWDLEMIVLVAMWDSCYLGRANRALDVSIDSIQLFGMGLLFAHMRGCQHTIIVSLNKVRAHGSCTGAPA